MNRDKLKQFEEQKRERCWNAQERWRILQETIAWVDSQQAVPRNSKAGCLAKQARLLGGDSRSHVRRATV